MHIIEKSWQIIKNKNVTEILFIMKSLKLRDITIWKQVE